MYYGGIPLSTHIKELQTKPPHIAVGCPGRMHELIRNGYMKVDKVKYFVVDECDRMMS